MATISLWWMWLAFAVFIVVMLLVDMFLLGGKKAHCVSTKEALVWSLVWIGLALLFNFLIWLYLQQTANSLVAKQKALEFLTAYLIEKSLSVDNLFVFLMFFNYFATPPEYQRRILLFGVFGAIVMRMILILLGLWLIQKIHWILYLFGLFLVVTSIRLIFFSQKEPDLGKNPVLRWMQKHFRISNELQGERFFIRRNNLLYLTPLFVVLVLVEITDLIFAVDSIPAVFAITEDPFIVFTSNIFAVLGLRALYFLLANMVGRFHLLKYGLGIILLFIGLKMLIVAWIKIPILITLGFVVIVLALSILLSLLIPVRKYPGQ